MSKKQKFVDFVNENLFNKWSGEIDADVKDYWESLCDTDAGAKPKFSDIGKAVIMCMRENDRAMKSKDIADIMGASSRTVSGAMRKLTREKYVDKLGKDPVIYELTELGRTTELD